MYLKYKHQMYTLFRYGIYPSASTWIIVNPQNLRGSATVGQATDLCKVAVIDGAFSLPPSDRALLVSRSVGSNKADQKNTFEQHCPLEAHH